MIITYWFVDGTSVEIEVEQFWGDLIKEFDRINSNAERRWRYHCYSSDAMLYEGLERSYEDEGIKRIIEGGAVKRFPEEKVVLSIPHLKPSYKEIIIQLYYKRMMGKDFAALKGVSRNAVSEKKKNALKKLKEEMEKIE